MTKTSNNNEDFYYEIVRKNIRRYRKFSELTQEQLAEKVGVSKEFIGQMESPKIRKRCTIGTLGRISDALNVPITKFFEE